MQTESERVSSSEEGRAARTGAISAKSAMSSRPRSLQSTIGTQLLTGPWMCVWCLAVLLASAGPVEGGDAARDAVETFPTTPSPGAGGSGSGAVPDVGGGMPHGRGVAGFSPQGPGGAGPGPGHGYPRFSPFGSGPHAPGSAGAVPRYPGHLGHPGLGQVIRDESTQMVGPPYAFGPRPLMAVVQLMPNMGGGDGGGGDAQAAESSDMARDSQGVMGVLEMERAGPGLFVVGNLTGLAKGTYTINVHRSGDIHKGCDALDMDNMGPMMGWYTEPQVLGSLGLVMADAEGATPVRMMSPELSLMGPRGVLGRGLVIRKVNEDMHMHINSMKPQPILACGTVAAM